jgi:hypothetical protein
MPKNTPGRTIDIRGTTVGPQFVGQGNNGGGVTDHGVLTGLLDDDHTQYLNSTRGDARYVPLARTVTAGFGLTGGGALSGNITLAVGAGDGISVAADTVALASSVAGAALSYTSGVLAVVPGEGLEIETDAIGLASSVAGSGLTYSGGVLAVGVSGLGLGVGADAVTLTSSSNPGAAEAILASDASGYLTLVRLTTSDRLRSPLLDTAAGALTLSPAADLNLSPVSNVVLLDGKRLTGTAGFVSGFAGSGFELLYSSSRANLEVDNLTVRGRMNVYELMINRIRATNGALFVSDVAKATSVALVSGVNYRIYFDTEITCGLLAGDLIRAQKYTGSTPNPVYQCNMQVTTVSADSFRADLVSGDAPAAGMEFVRLGSATDATRRGSIYLTSSGNYTPYIDIVAGVDSFAAWNSAGKVRVRQGDLDGLSLPGAYTDEFGLFAGNGVAVTSQYVRLSDKAMLINNIPLQMSSGGVQTFNLAADGSSMWIGPSSANKQLDYNAGSLSITGTITAAAGSIANWSIGTVDANTISSSNTRLVSGNNARLEVGVAPNIAGITSNSSGGAPLFWAGSAYADRATSAPFRVNAAGALTASNATFGTVKVDTSGVFIEAPNTLDLNYGYKFKVGASNLIGSGLTVDDGSGVTMSLFNNSTDGDTTATVTNVNTVMNIKNVASGAGYTSQINLFAIRINTGSIAGLRMQAANTTRRALFDIDDDGLRINNYIAWHNGNLAKSEFAAASHTHSYLPLSGGTLTGAVVMQTVTHFQQIGGTPFDPSSLLSNDGNAIGYFTIGKRFVLAYKNNGGTMHYKSIRLDDSSTAWSYNTTPPA